MRQKQKHIIKKGTGCPACVVFVFGLLFYSNSYAQQLENLQDESVQLALSNAISIYDTQIGKNSFVNTGSSYFDDYDGIQGHQYFNDDYWEQGSLIYLDHTFDNIFLKYDIYRDLLLIEHFNSDGFLSPIQLFSTKVSSFNLMDHYFIWIEKDTLSNLKAGFYDQMYMGKAVEVMVKRRKEIVNSNEINSLREEFMIKDRYYIKKNEIYYKVKKKNSIIKVLADHKKELKEFIKKHNYQFKFHPDLELVEVVKYYDSLL